MQDRIVQLYLTTLVSHALSVETLKPSVSKTFTEQSHRSTPVSTDITKTRVRLQGRKQVDYLNGACFNRHKKGCRTKTCSERKHLSNLELEKPGKRSFPVNKNIDQTESSTAVEEEAEMAKKWTAQEVVRGKE